MNREPLDIFPLWCFFLMATGVGIFTLEAGYRFGRWRHEHAAEEKDAPVAAMVGSILGLLAIMLAFSFNLAILGMASMGYQAGLSATRRSPAMTLLTLAFSGVLFLIVDLDRPHEGLLRVSQKPMTDLQKTMRSGQR